MIPFYLDIETLPADPATFAPEPVEAPSNYKDEAKIAAYIADKQAGQLEKTSFDVHRGRLLCIGYASGNDAPSVTYDPGNVAGMLDCVADAMADNLRANHGRLVVVGHNIAAFDAVWLWRLAIKHRSKLAGLLPYERYGKGLADTMTMWNATDPKQFTSLPTIAKFLGEGDKDDMDGSEVWPAYQRGEHERIQKYCAKDVALTRAIYLRMTNPTGAY